MGERLDQLRAAQRFAGMRAIAVDQAALLVAAGRRLELGRSVLEATANVVQLEELKRREKWKKLLIIFIHIQYLFMLCSFSILLSRKDY